MEILNTYADVWVLLAIVLWTLPWKEMALLWRAAKNQHKAWFIAMLIVNTLAILEIAHIFYFSKKSLGNKKEKAANNYENN